MVYNFLAIFEPGHMHYTHVDAMHTRYVRPLSIQPPWAKKLVSIWAFAVLDDPPVA